MADIILTQGDVKRFRDKCVRNVESGCLEWTRCLVGGYGAFQMRGKSLRSHRIAWVLAYGQIPDGMLVCHHCDNPRCVEVSHLFLGTTAENLRDRDKKGRARGGGEGMRHSHARLTDDIVREIRALYASGSLQKDIAGRFGVRQSHVSKICRRESWSHLA